MVFWGISRGLGDCAMVNEIDRSRHRLNIRNDGR
jgi:hypothetical protein